MVYSSFSIYSLWKSIYKSLFEQKIHDSNFIHSFLSVIGEIRFKWLFLEGVIQSTRSEIFEGILFQVLIVAFWLEFRIKFFQPFFQDLMRFVSGFEIEAIEEFEEIRNGILCKITSILFTIIIELKNWMEVGIKIFPKLVVIILSGYAKFFSKNYDFLGIKVACILNFDFNSLLFFLCFIDEVFELILFDQFV